MAVENFRMKSSLNGTSTDELFKSIVPTVHDVRSIDPTSCVLSGLHDHTMAMSMAVISAPVNGFIKKILKVSTKTNALNKYYFSCYNIFMPWGKFYSYLLVLLQLILIFFIITYSFFRNLGFIQITLINLGIILGLWSIIVMKKSKIRAIPDVAKEAKLIKNGPYKYIRHPMYASVLTACLGFLLTNIYSMTILFYTLLIIVLNIKIAYEESLLVKTFPKYKSYTKKTKKLIPFVY